MKQYLIRVDATDFRHVRDTLEAIHQDFDRVRDLSPEYRKREKHTAILLKAMNDSKPEGATD